MKEADKPKNVNDSIIRMDIKLQPLQFREMMVMLVMRKGSRVGGTLIKMNL